MSIGDQFETICSTHDVKFAGFRDVNRPVWGIQFHPEVWHSTDGPQLLKNFVIGICGCELDPGQLCRQTVAKLRDQIGATRSSSD